MIDTETRLCDFNDCGEDTEERGEYTPWGDGGLCTAHSKFKRKLLGRPEGTPIPRKPRTRTISQRSRDDRAAKFREEKKTLGKSKARLIECMSCGETKTYGARGMCQNCYRKQKTKAPCADCGGGGKLVQDFCPPCYQRHLRAGTLETFERVSA